MRSAHFPSGLAQETDKIVEKYAREGLYGRLKVVYHVLPACTGKGSRDAETCDLKGPRLISVASTLRVKVAASEAAVTMFVVVP
jgi:hypothetical protein